MQKINIIAKDNQRKNIKDTTSINNNGSKRYSPRNPKISNDIKGRVRVYEKEIGKGKKLYLVQETNNLVLYRGRNWLAQRALYCNLSTERVGWRDRFINWIAIGSGGAVSGSPLEPTSPALPNYQLSAHGTVNDGTRYITVNGKDYHNFDPGFPKLVYDEDVDEVNLEPVTSVDPVTGDPHKCDSFLIGEIKITLEAHECNGGTMPGDYQDISEAGLFVSPSSDVGHSFAIDDLEIFARVCFSTIRKDANKEIIFTWLLYF